MYFSTLMQFADMLPACLRAACSNSANTAATELDGLDVDLLIGLDEKKAFEKQDCRLMIECSILMLAAHCSWLLALEV